MNMTSAIILSGGLSKRMGSDKCELEFNNKTFLNHQIEKFKNIGINDIIVSGYRGKNCNERIIIDNIMKGPLSGIYLGLREIKNEQSFVISVDIPLFEEEIIKKMINYSKNIEFDVLCLRHNKKIEPLISIFKKNIVNKLEKFLAGKNFTVRGFFDLINTKYYDCDNYDENIFLNINHKNEYEDLINLNK